jgi:spore maturation protein CgeB
MYFESIPEMTEKARWLLARDSERDRLRQAAHRIVLEGNHTYRDRLSSILQTARVTLA